MAAARFVLLCALIMLSVCLDHNEAAYGANLAQLHVAKPLAPIAPAPPVSPVAPVSPAVVPSTAPTAKPTSAPTHVPNVPTHAPNAPTRVPSVPSRVPVTPPKAPVHVPVAPMHGPVTPISPIVPTGPLDCFAITACDNCSSHNHCAWCDSRTNGSKCVHISEISTDHCDAGWCTGETCKYICDPLCVGIFPCSHSTIGMVILIILYGIVLGYAAKLISDGSELLLELFPNYGTVIGALLLPILGAVPDAAIILVSGFGPVAKVQQQLSVGVGTLAGSTIMLLTVPWALSLWVARCDIVGGEAQDGISTSFSLTKSGITVDFDTRVNAIIMIVSTLSYFIVQGVAFAKLSDSLDQISKAEKYYSLAGMIVCFVGLIAYCVYQVYVPKLAKKRADKVEKAKQERIMRLRALNVIRKMQQNLPASKQNPPVEVINRTDEEKQAITRAFGQKWRAAAKKSRAQADTNDSEQVKLLDNEHSVQHQEEDSSSEESDEPRWKLIVFSMAFILIGTGLVAFFSDPMVDVISDFGNAVGIPVFYVSFIVTPYCSNASELVSSLVFAAKKKKTNSSMTYSQLYGAATLNNTLGLGIFFALIFFRGLAWDFSSETLSIFLITVGVGIVGSVYLTIRLWWSLVIMLFYPLSLVIVYVLDTYAHWK